LVALVLLIFAMGSYAGSAVSSKHGSFSIFFGDSTYEIDMATTLAIGRAVAHAKASYFRASVTNFETTFLEQFEALEVYRPADDFIIVFRPVKDEETNFGNRGSIIYDVDSEDYSVSPDHGR
jgi:hypothetical protein